MALAKGFPALALMSEGDLAQDFGSFATALEGALDPIVGDFRQQMVRAYYTGVCAKYSARVLVVEIVSGVFSKL